MMEDYTALTPADLTNCRDQKLVLRIPILRACLWFLIILVALFVVLPSVYLLLWAFAGSETVGILAVLPSLHWFRYLLSNPDWQMSITYSVVLAIVVSGIGCAILLVHFYYMRYLSSIFDRLTYASIFLVVLMPTVTYALALRLAGGALHLPEMILLLMGHLVFVLPLQFFVIESKQESIPSNLLFAGSTLGASHFRNIRFVYLPLMADALWNAFIVGFFFSFDELVIATFIIDSPFVTVPRRLWDQVNRSMDPAPAVISCLVAGVCALIVAATLIRRRIHCMLETRK